MPVHKQVTNAGIYFITFTNYQWLWLLEKTKGYDLVYKWFDILSTKQHAINGFVIMPNHLHLLLYYAGGSQSPNTIVGNGKRFMAYDIAKRLQGQKEESTLLKMQRGVSVKDKSRGKKHEVWEDSFDVKECRTEKFVLQKLNYIHNNPCTERWKLASSPIDYLHSSARFYISGRHAGYKVKDYLEFLKFDLWDEK